MLEGALWFIGSYVAGMAVVHLYRCLYHYHGNLQHYVLITCNNQLQVEWYVRSLMAYQWLKGSPMKITIIDQGSTDDTLRIIQRLIGQREATIQTVDAQPEQLMIASAREEEIIRVELNNQEDLHKLPLLQ